MTTEERGTRCPTGICHLQASEIMDEDGIKGEVLVSEPSKTSDNSREDQEEALVPEPFKYYSNLNEIEEAKASRLYSKR